jgi:acyl-CoA thioester hydrolase
MTAVNHQQPIPLVHELNIRVRYQETDGQGRVHHSNYANYFEMGRVEMLRSGGRTYRDLEDAGIMLVVISLRCDYFRAARYDDLLRLRTSVSQARGVRITHQYQLFLETELIAEGETVVAAIDRAGNVVRLPVWLQLPRTSPVSSQATDGM